MIRLYRAYGLTLSSEIALPELDAGGGAAPDVHIALQAVTGPMPTIRGDRFCEIRADSAYFAWNGLGRMHVSGWTHVAVAPEPGVEQSDLALALLGPVMAALLHGRGNLVLHGSSVVGADGCAMLFVGDNGAGKSTLAATCIKAGLTLVNDDVAVITITDDGTAQIRRGFPAMKLSRAALASLHPMPGEPLPPSTATAAKLRIRLPAASPDAPLRLGHIFKVRRSDRLAIQPMEPEERLKLALRYAYMPKLGPNAITPESAPRHFRHCAALAHRTPASILTVPDGLDALIAAAAQLAAQNPDHWPDFCPAEAVRSSAA